MNPTDSVFSEEDVVERLSRPGKRSRLHLGLYALIILAVGSTLYFYNEVRTLKTDPTRVAQVQINTLIANVGRHLILPTTGEAATAITVDDLTPLARDPFLSKAKIGNQILLYPTSGRIVIYDQLEDRIIDVGAISAPPATPTK